MREKVKITYEKEIKHKKFRVTVFGSSRMKKNDKNYKEVYNLAKSIGERGLDIVTGGGPGIMEAASRGHQDGSKKTKAHSIGLSIKLPHEQGTNSAVQIEKKFDRFSQRLDNFVLLSNAVVVAPGGVGTMLELLYIWQLVQTNKMHHTPIILMGDMWNDFMKWLKKEPLKKKFFDKKDLKLLFHAKSNKKAIEIIDRAHRKYNRSKGHG